MMTWDWRLDALKICSIEVASHNFIGKAKSPATSPLFSRSGQMTLSKRELYALQDYDTSFVAAVNIVTSEST